MNNLKITIISLFAFVLTTSFCSGQKTQQAQNGPIVGDWKGTSICQVKNSACHDEQALYHIFKTEKPNVYRIEGSKIVNGEEVEMGTLYFDYDDSKHNLTSVQNNTSKWTFEIHGDSMHGNLTDKNVLFRLIDLKRIK